MTDKEFKPGDRVVLKSGGPTMTVVRAAARVECVFWDMIDYKECSFLPACLEPYEDPDL